MKTINIKGDIIVNEYAWIYDYLKWDYVSPAKVNKILSEAEKDEEIDVLINSPGGHVMAGQEIYSALSKNPNVHISIEGMACSAASVIAMAGKSSISPVGMLMIHNVSGGAEGDYHEMDKVSTELKQMNSALANAYHTKSGMEMEKLLRLMDKETWLTANQCIEYGLIDEIEKPVSQQNGFMLNSINSGIRLTDEIRQKVEKEVAEKKQRDEIKNQLIEDLDLYGV